MRYTTLLALFFVASVLALPTTSEGDETQEASISDNSGAQDTEQGATSEGNPGAIAPSNANTPKPNKLWKTETLWEGANTLQQHIRFNSSSLPDMFETTIILQMDDRDMVMALSGGAGTKGLWLRRHDKVSVSLDTSDLHDRSAVIISLQYSPARGLCPMYQALWDDVHDLQQLGNCLTDLKPGPLTAFYGYRGVKQTHRYNGTTGLFLDATVPDADTMDTDVSIDGKSSVGPETRDDVPNTNGLPQPSTIALPAEARAINEAIVFQSTIKSDFLISIDLRRGNSNATLSVSRKKNNKWMYVQFNDQKPMPVGVADVKMATLSIELLYKSTGFCASFQKLGSTITQLGCVQHSVNDSGPGLATYYNNGVKQDIAGLIDGVVFYSQVTVLDADGKPPTST